MLKRAKLLECPFTWDINEELSAHHNDATELPVTMKDQPAIALMNGLMAVYCSTMQKDYEKAKRKLDELDELRDSVDVARLAKENISSEVLNHVVWSTIFHVREITEEDITAADVAFEQIPNARNYSAPRDEATIHGCRAIAFSYFHEAVHQKATIHARKAIDIFSECPLWHLILYKNHRRARRIETFGTTPSDDERTAMFECTRMSIEPFYLIHQAEMYRECKETELAKIVYQMVHETEPDSTEVLLRLANGFIKCSRLEMSGKCLDKVAKTSSRNPMYLQYRGLYFSAIKRYKEAATCYKAAAECGVYVAEFQYVACRMRADKSFECTDYLNEMLERCQNDGERQHALLLLAMQYRKIDEFTKSGEYFVRAIEIDRSAWLLKNFKNRLSFTNKRIHNVFEYVNEFIPECKKKKVDAAVIQRLQELCGVVEWLNKRNVNCYPRER